MDNRSVHNVVGTYCSIARLKEEERESRFQKRGSTREIVATHVFGAQQIAWLYWSESAANVDIYRVNVLLAFHEVHNFDVPTEIKAFENEFIENITPEAKFAHLCSDLEDWLYSVDFACTPELVKFINENYSEFSIGFDSLKNVVYHYNILSALKHKTRRGWIRWNVNVPHLEVVSEHAFGTQPLAWLIYLGTQSDVDIYKVTAMMALHETEESLMPDYVPSDPITPEEMLAEGKAAVAKALGGLKQFDLFDKLLDEFNARETPEGKFAHLCDKLECVFRAKMYTDLGVCPIENGMEDEKADPIVQKHLAEGAKTVAELFYMRCRDKFVGTPFEEIGNCLLDYDTAK